MKPTDRAFPQLDYINEQRGPVTITDEKQPGLSLRAYYAAHAPAEPQPWFLPVLPTAPILPADKPSLADDFPERAEDRNYIINLAWNWRRDPTWDLSTFVEDRPNDGFRAHGNALLAHARPSLVEYENAWKAYWDAKVAHEIECQRQRYIQWPWAWADAVLAAGGGL